VERLMNRRKQFRAVAVADIFIWLRARPDRREDLA
jgi:hypothetical protein